jgi:predicted transcriptional regulator
MDAAPGNSAGTKRDGAVLCAVMPDLLDTIRQEIDSRLDELRPLAREASDLQRALDALSEVPAVPAGDGRGRRRRSNQRVSPRPRSPRGDTRARVMEFVASNPGSTAGDVARALGLNRNAVATRLAQLAKSGELAKAERGYAAPKRS